MALDPEIRRRLNDHRRRLFEDTAGEIAFLCECADVKCVRSVVLSPARFDALRDRGQILLHVGHEALRIGVSPAPDLDAAVAPVDAVAIGAESVEPASIEAVQAGPLQVDPVSIELPEVDPPGPEPLQ